MFIAEISRCFIRCYWSYILSWEKIIIRWLGVPIFKPRQKVFHRFIFSKVPVPYILAVIQSPMIQSILVSTNSDPGISKRFIVPPLAFPFSVKWSDCLFCFHGCRRLTNDSNHLVWADLWMWKKQGKIIFYRSFDTDRIGYGGLKVFL